MAELLGKGLRLHHLGQGGAVALHQVGRHAGGAEQAVEDHLLVALDAELGIGGHLGQQGQAAAAVDGHDATLPALAGCNMARPSRCRR
jgi:hypothetical protein